MDKEKIAHVAHEANRAYCRSIGDGSQPPWQDAPDWQRQSILKGVEFHLESYASNGVAPFLSDCHNNWLKEKRLGGWKYGPIKDTDKKEHPCFVAYEKLTLEQRFKDCLFRSIVQVFVEEEGAS